LGTNAKPPSITHATIFLRIVHSRASFAPAAPVMAAAGGHHPPFRNAFFKNGVPAPLSPVVSAQAWSPHTPYLPV